MKNKSIRELRQMLDEKITLRNKSKTTLSEIYNSLEKNGEELNDEDFQKKIEYQKSVQEELDKTVIEITNIQALIETKQSKRSGELGDKIIPEVETVKTLKDDPDFIQSYVKAIEFGDTADYNRYQKTLSTLPTDGSTAGASSVLVPTFVDDIIRTEIEHYGGLFEITNKFEIKGLYKIAIEKEATGVHDHNELDPEVPEEEITLGEAILDPDYIKKWITWTHKLRALSGIDLVSEILKEFMRKFMAGYEERGFNAPANGTRLEGIVTYAKGTTEQQKFSVPVIGTGKVTFTDILALLGNVRMLPGQSGRWFMKQETFYNSVLNIVDLNNRPIWSSSTNKDSKPMQYIYGYPVSFTDAFPDHSKASSTDGTIAFVAEEAYEANFPEGLTPKIIEDNVTLATQNKDRLIGRLLVAGRLTKLKGASVLIKGSSTAPVDVVAPEISITTSSITAWTTSDDGTITYGDLVTEAGIIATDDVDGDVTANIVFDGTKSTTDNIDLSTTGSKTVTLDVDDSAGNSATQKTVTIEIVTREALINEYTELTGKNPSISMSTKNLIAKIKKAKDANK